MNPQHWGSLEDATALARWAHSGQVDKAGEDYISHPLRVSDNCISPEAKIAGVLHDVIEDCGVTIEMLQLRGFPASSVEAVALLTKSPDVEYSDYISRIKNHPVAREVKRADLRDNMRIERIVNPTGKDYQRIEKYRGALAILESAVQD